LERSAIDARPTSIAMMSTSGRATLIDGPECNAAYWVSNLRHPVVFAQASMRSSPMAVTSCSS
jgi:acyl transferase domain-containing protein